MTLLRMAPETARLTLFQQLRAIQPRISYALSRNNDGTWFVTLTANGRTRETTLPSAAACEIWLAEQMGIAPR